MVFLHYKTTEGVIMYNLIGEYRVRIDEKGRIKLPKDLKRQLNQDVSFPLIVNRGYEKHLMLYPKDVWDRKTKEINRLNINKSKERQAIRYFYRGASELNLDNIERILIPGTLLEYAAIGKDVVLFAYNEQIELLDAAAYEKSLADEPANFGEVMDNINIDSGIESTEQE